MKDHPLTAQILPTLTAEEEVDMFRQLAASEGDEKQEIKNLLVRHNLGLVFKNFHRIVKGRVSQDEAISEALLTMNNCIDRFDVDQGWKFSTYYMRSMFNAFGALGKKEQKNREFSAEGDIPENSYEDIPVNEYGFEEIMFENRAGLTVQEQYVIHYRFMCDRTMTLKEIASGNGCTKETIRNIQKAGLKKLRMHLSSI